MKQLCIVKLAITLAIVLLATQSALAQTTQRALLGSASFAALAFSTDRTSIKSLDQLRAKTSTGVPLRIIIGLRVPFAPEGQLSATNSTRQRAEIISARANLLSKVPTVRRKVDKIKNFDHIPFIAMEVDAVELEQLANLAEVTSIQEDRLMSTNLAQSVPMVGGTSAWASGYTGAGRTVAVLDTGVDKTHPFLTGKVVSEACYSTTNSSYASTSICPGGVSSSTAAGSAMPYASGVCSTGECDHGTHVAGIVAGNNGSLYGVAKSANLIAVQVFSRFDSTAWCGGSAPCALTWSSDQILGLQRVYALRGTYNIDAVNMSLGGGSYASQTTCDTDNAAVKAAIDNLRSVNIATVIASGNSGYTTSMGAPGCISSAVSVGATLDTVDSVDSYSNSVSYLNLLAPGSGITSAVPSSSYSTWNGTSMATPHVAGAWAILRQKAPTATVSEVLAALTSSGVAVTDSRNSVVKPRINLPAALTALVPGISYALNVSKAGTGTGSVTSSPEGIDCGSTCRANFSNGTVAVLNPVATDTNLFTGWSGACSGTGACSITMNATKDVTANFFLGTANTPINQSNLAGATGSSAYYSFSVPAGASNLVISISGGTGDVDLYVRASAQPTTSVFDCAPYESGNEETCAFATPLATSYYILLAGYSAFSGVTLTATYTTATPYSAGTLGFTTPTTTIRESTVNAVIIVTRSNGSDGAASVSYSTIAGTALAGMDYTPVAGSLAWGSGDSSSRSFNIPIINNAIRNQKSRGFTVNLASAAGASLGFTTSMTVNILDDDVITMPWLNLLLLDD